MSAVHVLEAGAVVWEAGGDPELSLSLAWPEGILGEAAVGELADGWLGMLAGLAAHGTRPGSGGHTPSDFPLAGIGQGELAELETRWRTRN
jgi:non-ribosomal peptide synthase protein (TIGR01720 family)